ncbi:MAG TPA: sugar phosphate isomerase/epimerase family protein [Vicinamibacterales bacterium]
MTFTRRDWMRVAGQAAFATTIARSASASRQTAAPARGPVICFFSKHLPDLGWTELGRAVKDTGFDGVDLTVRAGGHVLPARAADDLPRAIDAIKSQGVAVPMVTTELTSAGDATAKPLLQAAVRSGVRYFKPGYWRYTSSSDVRSQVAAASRALEGLAALARDCGIELGFHNHAGYIGAALWEIAPVMDRLDPQWAGYYFDPRHAVAEGGGGAWKAATRLVAPRLKMVALKDFFWKKSEKGWVIEDCPMGEGMVDWAWIGKMLRDANFNGPISIHFEYEIPGSTPQERTHRTLEAAKRDLAFTRRFLHG